MSISLKSHKRDTDGQVPRKLEQATALPQGATDSVSPQRKKYLISQLIIAKSYLQR